MPKNRTSDGQTQGTRRRLKSRLAESEETLRAIGENLVDAFVVTRQDGMKVVTLNGAEFPYHTMVESMNEGAVTLIPDGTIFYCNLRFAEMVGRDPKSLIGIHFQELLPGEQEQLFQTILHDAGQEARRGEFCLRTGQEKCLPVQLSFYGLGVDVANGIAILATDITERKATEEKIRDLASELTVAEQEERHRISQILHDDLQQRLFAIRAQLAFLSASFEPGNTPSEMQAAIEQVQGELTEAINITRNLSVDVSPSVLQGEGLAEAIRWLSARMKEQHNLQLEVNIKDELPSLPDHMRVTLFQTAREMLFNVVKHSGVLQANITLERLDGAGSITITDHGRGFDAQTVLSDPQATHGLMIVRNRLQLMGSTLDIHSLPGDGTQVKIKFPLTNELDSSSNKPSTS